MACRLLGREQENLIGKSVWTEFHEALGSQFDRQYHLAIEEHRAVHFDEYYEPLKKWFRVRACPVNEGLYVYFEDITSTKSMESEIERSHHLLSQAQEIADIGLWEWNIVSDQITWSDGAIRIGHQLKSTGSLKYFLSKLVHSEDRHAVLNAIRGALAGQAYDIEYRFLRPNGETRIVHSQGAVFVDGSESPIKMMGIAKDVTEKRQVETKLRESEERYRTLVENSLNVIAVADGRNWTYMNEAGLELFGANSFVEVTGKPVNDFLHPDYRTMYEGQMRLVLVEKRPLHLPEVKWYTFDKKIIESEVSAVPLSFQGETSVQLIIRDISHKRQAQQLLMQSEKLSAVGQLAAGVAHEVRNPLRALKGFLQVLRSDYNGDKQEYFEIMEREVNRIDLISSEMLMLAKPQAVTYEKRDVQSLLHGVVALLETQALMKNVLIVTQYDSAPPILCAETAMKQVFIKLIKNAIEAMPDGGKVTIRMKEAYGKVIVQIEDEGSGISEDILSKLGQPFLTTKGDGTGLGLMVTQKIVEDHLGTIAFTSQVGVGTIVNVVIPAVNIKDVKLSESGA